MDFTGQHIVVTGASTGIGRATVVRLVAGGAKVTAIARRADLLQALCAELGDRARWAAADVGDQAQLTKALDSAVAQHGPIDGLFLNAGTGGTFAPLEAYSDENFASLMAVNMMGPFWAVRHVLPGMKARGRGAILITGSLASERGMAMNVAYVMSKHAVLDGLPTDERNDAADVVDGREAASARAAPLETREQESEDRRSTVFW